MNIFLLGIQTQYIAPIVGSGEKIDLSYSFYTYNDKIKSHIKVTQEKLCKNKIVYHKVNKR